MKLAFAVLPVLANHISSSAKRMKLIESDNHKVFSPHEREKLRLIGQELKYMGLKSTLRELGSEAGVMLDHPVISDLQQSILGAEWDVAYRNTELMVEIVEKAIVDQIRYMIMKRKFYELLEAQEFASAYVCMRTELTQSPCSDVLEIARLTISTRAKTPPSLEERELLVATINEILPCDVIVPPQRLRKLLQQSYDLQVGRCLCHNHQQEDYEMSSLFTDHSCPKDVLPINIIKTLEFSDAVLSVKFSPDGLHLAVGTKDSNLVIFSVNNSSFQMTRRFMVECSASNDSPLSCLVWHPDGQFIMCSVSGKPSNFVIIFDMQTGSHKRMDLIHDVQQVTWDTINREQFFAGGKSGNIILSNIGGVTVFSHQGYRVVAMHCLKNGFVVVADAQRRVVSYNLISMAFEVQFTEDSDILSMEFDAKEDLLALTLNNSTITLWDFKAKTKLYTYVGATLVNNVVRTSFGGINQSFLVSGSEDCNVYMWNHTKSKKLFSLAGHTNMVNAVHWNPVNHMMMASCSDDEKVIIWGPEKARIEL